LDQPTPTARVALVTGSASGVMRGVSASLAAHGYRLAINYRAPRSHADETLALIRSRAPQAEVVAFAADVARPDEAADLVARTHRHFGRLDVVVCGAGPMIVKDFIDMPAHEFAAMMDGNLGSAVFVIRAVLPHMRVQAFGRIITFGMTGSEAAMGARHLSAYAAAKAAVVTFTRSLALEEAPHGITCNAIDIGDIRDKEADRQTALQRRDYRNPTMRPGSWEDVAEAVLFLASDNASFVNGSVLTVSGGWQGFLAEFSRWP